MSEMKEIKFTSKRAFSKKRDILCFSRSQCHLHTATRAAWKVREDCGSKRFEKARAFAPIAAACAATAADPSRPRVSCEHS